MNKEVIKGHWNEMKGKLKQKWGKLTDDDVTQINGSYDVLLGNIQKRYGYEKEQAETEVKQFMDQNGWNK